MKLIITIITLLSFCNLKAQNEYVGTWEVHDIRSFKNKQEVTQKEFKSLTSQLVFRSDMTFIKTTNDKITEGKYEYSSNIFKFYERDQNGKYYVSWSIRIPKNSKIELNYPELFTVINPDGKQIQVELDVYYRKLK